LQRVPEVAVEIVVVVPLLRGQARPDSLERLSPSTLVKLPKRQHIRSLTPHELKSDLVCEVVCFGYVRPLGGHPLSRRLNLRIQLRACFVTFVHNPLPVLCRELSTTATGCLRATLTYPTRTRPRTGCTDTAGSALAVSVGTLSSGASRHTSRTPQHQTSWR